MKAKMPIAEQDAFLQMVEENRGTLYKVCLMFSSRQSEDLRDLYQEIVCRLWEGRERFDGRSSCSTWLYRVAMNTALNWQRDGQRRPVLVPLDTLDNRLLYQEANHAADLYALAERLNPDEKALLWLYLEGVKLRQIAQVLDTTEVAVKKRIQRMKNHLIIISKEEQI